MIAWRRWWNRRAVRPTVASPGAGNLVAFGIHALLIGDVVAALGIPGICLTRIGPCRCPEKKPACRAYGSSGPRVAGKGSQCRTKACSDRRAGYSSGDGVLICYFLRR